MPDTSIDDAVVTKQSSANKNFFVFQLHIDKYVTAGKNSITIVENRRAQILIPLASDKVIIPTNKSILTNLFTRPLSSKIQRLSISVNTLCDNIATLIRFTV